MIILFLLILIAAIAAYRLLPLFGGGHQAFTDIIIENVSASGLNKAGELQLFWLILITGALSFAAVAFSSYPFSGKKGNHRQLHRLFPISFPSLRWYSDISLSLLSDCFSEIQRSPVYGTVDFYILPLFLSKRNRQNPVDFCPFLLCPYICTYHSDTVMGWYENFFRDFISFQHSHRTYSLGGFSSV